MRRQLSGLAPRLKQLDAGAIYLGGQRIGMQLFADRVRLHAPNTVA